jgi:hypothetical protein
MYDTHINESICTGYITSLETVIALMMVQLREHDGDEVVSFKS